MSRKINKSFKYLRIGFGIMIFQLLFEMIAFRGGRALEEERGIFKEHLCFLVGLFLVFFATYVIVKNLYRKKRMIFWLEREKHLDQARGILFAARLSVVYMIIATMIIWYSSINNIFTNCFLVVAVLTVISVWHEIAGYNRTNVDKLYSFNRNKKEKIGGFLLYNFKDYDIESKLEDTFALKYEDVQRLIQYHKWSGTPWDLFENRIMLLKTDSQEDLDKAYDFAYEKYAETKNNLLTRTIIYCKVSSGISLKIPEKYKQTEFISLYQTSDSEFELDKVKDLQGSRMTLNSVKVTDYFANPDVFRTKLHLDENTQDLSGGNKFLSDFYRNALVFKSPQRSVMALLDYCELVLTLSAIYSIGYLGEDNKPSEKEFISSNMMKLAEIIKNRAVRDDSWENIITKKYQIPSEIMDSINELNKYIYVSFSGDKVSFLGLISLLTVIRNKVIAHGILTEENDAYLDVVFSRKGNAYIVWKILFWLTGCLNEYLRIGSLNFINKDNDIYVGYENKVSAGKLMIMKDEYPLIASKANDKGRITYVNYFNGEMVIPEYVR